MESANQLSDQEEIHIAHVPQSHPYARSLKALAASRKACTLQTFSTYTAMSFMLEHDVLDSKGMDVVEVKKPKFFKGAWSQRGRHPKQGHGVSVRWPHLVAGRHGRGTAETTEAPGWRSLQRRLCRGVPDEVGGRTQKQLLLRWQSLDRQYCC